jgi:hypothetical protein
MATAVVLTPQASTASVLLQITGAPAGAVVITRTDVNGTGTVRLRVGQVPIAGALTISDYEPALVGTISYDVVDSGGARVSASTTLAGLGLGPQVGGVQLPGLEFDPELITGYDSSRASSSTVLRVINRGDPVVVLAPTRTREGTLEVWCRDASDAHAYAEVLAQARVLLLRQPTHPGLDMYFLAQSVGVQPLQPTAEGWRWQVACQYVELRNPAYPLLGAAGWTFDDVAAYSSFAAVRAAFADFDALLVGV